MKAVKRISLFVIAVGLFVIGCFLGFEGHNFFYPGMGAGTRMYEENAVTQPKKQEVSVREENMITADTSFVVIKVDLEDRSETSEEIPVPTYYMGMDRETFEKQIKNFDRSPSLKEQQNGFQGSEIRSFSGSKVELCKFYRKKEEAKEGFYYLAILDNKVVVYQADEKTVYMETDIKAEELPADLMQELLLQKRVVNTEEELFDFLESYSS